ncbi:HD domain-containing phosphohydrolase [Marinomonas sp. 5E14-1]|uniref:HD domain-containing phosphohydrolase n=1 Tax=Marinomonas sp. 5E14-1 TaxID=3153922 RepID=UPI00326642AB
MSVIDRELLDKCSFFVSNLPVFVVLGVMLDGSGYPSGLVGDEIPLAARIVAIADGFDAINNGTIL